MSLIIPPGFAQVAWRWELNGDPEYIWTTCGISLSDAGGNMQAACDRASFAMDNAFPAAQMSNQWRYRGCVMRVGQDGGPPAVFETIANVVGVGGATILPQNCAMLVRKLTASAGRRNRGRMYMPILGILETAVNQVGAIDAASVTSAQARITMLYDVLHSDPALTLALWPVILHSDTPGQVTAPGNPTPVTGFALEPVIATQRRRMRR